MSTLIRITAAAALLSGCTNEAATVVATAYGEEFIEQGIPSDMMNDGWSVDFERFEVTISEITVGGLTLPDAHIVDLSEASDGDGHELDTLELPVGDYDGSSFVIEHVEVDGSAEKDGELKTFSWVFDTPVAYDECETMTKVTAGDTANFQITVHADHLFYDSLVAEEPQLRFQPLAEADNDGDGEIEAAELAETDIGAYDPGSSGGIDDLWAFLSAQVTTLGHVDGEGHCHGVPVD